MLAYEMVMTVPVWVPGSLVRTLPSAVTSTGQQGASAPAASGETGGRWAALGGNHTWLPFGGGEGVGG